MKITLKTLFKQTKTPIIDAIVEMTRLAKEQNIDLSSCEVDEGLWRRLHNEMEEGLGFSNRDGFDWLSKGEATVSGVSIRCPAVAARATRLPEIEVTWDGTNIGEIYTKMSRAFKVTSLGILDKGELEIKVDRYPYDYRSGSQTVVVALGDTLIIQRD